MHKIAIVTTLALCTLSLAVACSEADDGATPTFGVDAGNTVNTSVDASSSSPAPSSTSSDAGGTPVQVKDGGAVSAAIVVNEISGKGEEWVELVNASNAAVDISGYGITDREKEGGAPKMSDAVMFPAGTVLSPNAYVIVGNPPSDAGSDASACPTGGQSYCIKDSFGISNSEGDSVFVLDPAQNVIEQADYPANTVASGQTWGRLPNATGAFAVNQPTPGAVNKSP